MRICWRIIVDDSSESSIRTRRFFELKIMVARHLTRRFQRNIFDFVANLYLLLVSYSKRKGGMYERLPSITVRRSISRGHACSYKCDPTKNEKSITRQRSPSSSKRKSNETHGTQAGTVHSPSKIKTTTKNQRQEMIRLNRDFSS